MSKVSFELRVGESRVHKGTEVRLDGMNSQTARFCVWRVRNVGAWFWGVVLTVLLVMLFGGIWVSLLYCDIRINDAQQMVPSCSGWQARVYVLLRDVGTGLGALAAGVGLAWSTFIRRN